MACVDEPTFTVRVDVADPPAEGVTGVGERAHVEEEGHPETVRATGEANPFSEATVTV